MMVGGPWELHMMYVKCVVSLVMEIDWLLGGQARRVEMIPS